MLSITGVWLALPGFMGNGRGCENGTGVIRLTTPVLNTGFSDPGLPGHVPNFHNLSLPSVGNGECTMDIKLLKWLADLGMGITFAVCFITGLLKFSLLLQVTGLNDLVLPSALISDLHDWSGILLGLFVLLHLYLNRTWIIGMTKNVLGGNRQKD
jgi:cytochrome b subunit of formate dehydrogenase